jgi:hypothetical protein
MLNEGDPLGNKVNDSPTALSLRSKAKSLITHNSLGVCSPLPTNSRCFAHEIGIADHLRGFLPS